MKLSKTLVRANRLHNKKEYKRACKFYEQALDENSNDALAHCLYGTLKFEVNQWGLAVKHLETAIGLRPSIIGAYVNLIASYRRLERPLQAIEAGDRIIRHFNGKAIEGEIAAEMASVYANRGAAFLELGEFRDAEASLRKALSYNAKHNDAHWNLGLVLLALENYEEGWAEYDWGFSSGERKPQPYFREFEPWIDQDPKGKTILVAGEQGLGDEILFAQCIPSLQRAGAKVIFDCHPRLERMFKRSLDCEIIGHRKEFECTVWDKYDIDYCVPIGSLARHFRSKREDFPAHPYLKPDPERVKFWREKYGKFVAITWRGGAKKTASMRRSIPLEKWAPILQQGVKFVSLQYSGPGEVWSPVEEILQTQNHLGIKIAHPDFAIDDYEETANVVAAADLVISVCGSIIHLSGALGKDTWILTPKSRAWRYPPTIENYWYANSLQYHQNEILEWDDVIHSVAEDLCKRS